MPYEDVITIRAIDETRAAVTSARANIQSLNAATTAGQRRVKDLTASATAAGAQNVAVMEKQRRSMSEWIHKNQLGLRMIGHDAQMVGQTIFRWVTIPMAAVGVVTAKMAYDFNTAMTKVQALTGTNIVMMKQYNEEVLNLSKSTGIGPTKVAEGLYFIASSGFKGAQALKILKESTQLAATGMGDMMFMGQTLTSAMTAWGPKILSAADAADTLVAAVREGKAEPDEFSRSLGRVIPVASQVGITFQEVGAAIAAMTNIGLSARISTFALRTLLTSFLKPQKPLIEGLKSIGLTVKGVVKQMTTDGFLPAMETIYKAAHGSATKITRMFTQNAGTAFLALFRSAGKTKEIFNELINSQGDAAKAFNVAMQSPAAKFRVALANLQVAAIELGAKFLPIFTKIVGWLSWLVDKFNNLSASTQAWIGWLLVATSVIGLISSGVGKLATMLTSMGSGWRMLLGKSTGPGMFAREKGATSVASAAAKEAAAQAAASEAAANTIATAAIEANTAATTSNTTSKKANAAARKAAQANAYKTLAEETALMRAANEARYAEQVAQATRFSTLEEGVVATSAVRYQQAIDARMVAQRNLSNLETSTIITSSRVQEAAIRDVAAAELAVNGARTQYLSDAKKAEQVASHQAAMMGKVGVEAEKVAKLSRGRRAVNFLEGIIGLPWQAVAVVAGIAAVGAAIYALSKAFSTARASAEDFKGVMKSVKDDASGEFASWTRKKLGGVFTIEGGKLEWRPAQVIITPKTADMVEWTKTQAAKVRQQQQMDANTAKIQAARVAADLIKQDAQLADSRAAGIEANLHKNSGRISAAAKADMEAQALSYRQQADKLWNESDQQLKHADELANNYYKIKRKFAPIVVAMEIKDMKAKTESLNKQLEKVQKRIEGATGEHRIQLLLKEQDILQRIDNVRQSVRNLRKESGHLEMVYKINVQENKIKDLRALLKDLRAQLKTEKNPEVRIQLKADIRQALIDMKTAQVMAEKFKGTYKGVVSVVVKLPKNKNPLKAAGLPNWISEASGAGKAAKEVAVNVTAETKAAAGALKGIREQMSGITNNPALASVDGDYSGVTSAVTNANIALNSIDGKTVTTYINAIRRPGKSHSGGIVTGPHEGYLHELHGTEAILPLEHPELIPRILEQAGILSASRGLSSTGSAASTAKAAASSKKVSAAQVAAKAARNATIIAEAVANAIYAATSKASRKRLQNAGELSGAVGDLVDFINSITTSLDILANTKVPPMLEKWRKRIRVIIQRAIKVADIAAKEINRALPWSKGYKDKSGNQVEPKPGSKAAAILHASEMTGPIGDLVSFISTVAAALKEVADVKMVSLTSTIKANVKKVTDQAIAIAKIVRTEIQKNLKTAFKQSTLDKASGVQSLVEGITSMVTALTEMTSEAIDKAIAGGGAVAAKLPVLTKALISIVKSLATAFNKVSVSPEITEAVDAASSMVGSITSVIDSLKEITSSIIDNAIQGAGFLAAKAPGLSNALKDLLAILASTLKDVSVSQELSDVAEATSTLVSNITSAISSLQDMTEKTVQDAIWGAGWIAKKAVDLGEAIRKMIGWIDYALGYVQPNSLIDLQARLDALSSLTGSISGIVNNLNEMTSGTLAGAITGTSVMSSSTSSVTQVVTININTGPIQAGSPSQAAASGDQLAQAIITRLAMATRSTARGMA